MRKLTVELEFHDAVKESMKPMFEDMYSFEVLETLKIDWEEAIVIDLIECQLKENVSIHDLTTLGKWEILSVLKSQGNKHTCLVKIIQQDEAKDAFKDLEVDVIYTTPSIISNEKYTVSVIGDNENLNKFVEIMKEKMGNIVNMSFKKAAYQKHDILSVLTDKQKNILIAANHYGYYDFPKKITSKELSQKVNISKPTLIQHLRKAEGRIMSNILAGHPLK
jgi:predicted DNA binding protein